MRNLNEGLRRGDLNGMVLPMLSIDEFSSKIDDQKMIVVGFFCFEEDPAHDLANFIERSPVNVVDTDVSPAPNKEGYYLTFVEFKRNKLFPEKLIELLREIDNLTDVEEWQFTSLELPKGKIVELTQDNLEKYTPLKHQAETTTEKLQEFFATSSLHDFQLIENQLILSRAGVVHQYELGTLIDNQIPQMAMCMESNAASAALRLHRMLDGTYHVHAVHDGLLVENTHLNQFLHLKIDPID
jgi:hypothetical protein